MQNGFAIGEFGLSDDFESILDAEWFSTEEERDKEFNKLVKDLDNQFLDHIRKMVFQ